MPSFLLESPDAKLDRIIADCDWRATIPLPTPEERDREIYEAVYIQRRKPAKVAREWNLTPITVTNIARQTRDQLARREHELDKLCKSGSLKAFYDELFDQQRELRESWEASKEGQTSLVVTAEGREPMRETIRNKGIGDVRLMRLIHQISLRMHAIEMRFAVDDMEERHLECGALTPLLDLSASRAEEGSRGAAEESPVECGALTPLLDLSASGAEEGSRGAAEEKVPEAILLPCSPAPLPVPNGKETSPLQNSQSGDKSPHSKSKSGESSPQSKSKTRRRRIGRRRGGLADVFTSLPAGVSTGSEALDRQLLAAINGMPFPAEPCACGDGGP